MEKEDVADALRGVLDERSRIDANRHNSEHDWVRERIEKERERAEFWRGLAAKSLPALAWALVASAAGAIWHVLTAHIKWN